MAAPIIYTTDVLVVGGGFSGSWAALSAAASAKDVLIVDKAARDWRGLGMMSGGDMIVMLPEFKVEDLLDEMVYYYDGLCDQPLVRKILEHSYDRFCDLERWGHIFARDEKGNLRAVVQRGLKYMRYYLYHPYGKGGPHTCNTLYDQLALRGVRRISNIQIVKLIKRSGKKPVREYTLGEEIFNAVTHGVGAGLAVAALVLLIVKSVSDGGGILLAAALVYGIAQLLEYLMSTLYHALAAERAKRVFKVLDHSGIYLLIAGTYTPYCLITLGHVGGVWLAAFVWAVSLVGIAFEAFWTYRPRWISAVLYVALGWSIVFFIPTLFAELAPAGFWLLVAGGISYTVGAVFYIFKKVRYMHSVFHLFVLAASCLQFFSVYFFVI